MFYQVVAADGKAISGNIWLFYEDAIEELCDICNRTQSEAYIDRIDKTISNCKKGDK